MVEAMKKVAVSGIELSVEERNLLSVAFKNVIGARRASWRIMTSIEQKSESKDESSKQNQVKNYRTQVCSQGDLSTLGAVLSLIYVCSFSLYWKVSNLFNFSFSFNRLKLNWKKSAKMFWISLIIT